MRLQVGRFEVSFTNMAYEKISYEASLCNICFYEERLTLCLQIEQRFGSVPERAATGM